MSKNQVLAAVLVLVSGALAYAGDQPGTAKDTQKEQPKGDQKPTAPMTATFRGTADLVDAVQIVPSFSPDKRAVTVLFRNMVVSVPVAPPPLPGTPPPVAAARAAALPPVGARSVSVALPIEAKGKEIRLRQIVRGFVSTNNYTRAVLVIQAAGKTTVVDPMKAADKDGNYQQDIEATLPGGASYQVTLFLLFERVAGDPPSNGQLTVDSLDVEIIKP